MIIDTPYEFGDIVFLKTDINQDEMIITEMRVLQKGVILYLLSRGMQSSSHYEYEFEREPDLSKKFKD